MKKIMLLLVLFVANFAAQSQVRTTRWEVKIPSLWCEECESIIESRMLRYDGIMEIDAKWRAKKAVIRYIPDRIDTANIKAFVAALGFDTDEDKADESQRKLLPECCQKPPPPRGKQPATAAATPAATTAGGATPATPGAPVASGAKPATPATPATAKPVAGTKPSTPAAPATQSKNGTASSSAKPTTAAKPATATSTAKPTAATPAKTAATKASSSTTKKN